MSYRYAGAAVAFLAALGLFAAPEAAHATSSGSSTPCSNRLISAHQGYRLNDDADTLESQQAAFDIGANIADSDMWVTKDGYIVEIHDNDVSHWTYGHGLITDMTLDQVKQLRTRPHNELVPQLGDSLALSIAHEPGRSLMFEAKPVFDDPANRQELDEELNAADMIDHVIIYTSGVKQAHAFKTLDPNLTVWLKGGPDYVPPMSWVQGLDGVMISAPLLTTEVVRQFHDAGIAVIRERVLTETKVNWKRFVTSGADGMMTDDPVIVIRRCRQLP